jgi:multidrug resistance efflux pump
VHSRFDWPPSLSFRQKHKGPVFTGYVEAESMIPVVPLVSGTILEYPVKAGQLIREEEFVARIDEAPFKQQMLQAKAGYFGLQSTFERVESLFKTICHRSGRE